MAPGPQGPGRQPWRDRGTPPPPCRRRVFSHPETRLSWQHNPQREVECDEGRRPGDGPNTHCPRSHLVVRMITPLVHGDRGLLGGKSGSSWGHLCHYCPPLVLTPSGPAPIHAALPPPLLLPQPWGAGGILCPCTPGHLVMVPLESSPRDALCTSRGTVLPREAEGTSSPPVPAGPRPQRSV